ncbi:hypothetical protein [Bacillus sp. MRMR6]|uniref:hypothetical protein n=1 Tax=Bacillus sp. MRMR6 TaxID=1928617 RepID=UPI000952044E|nr:hypothetical protein [Bacillus sp. MRMR6]OLS41645.1 hypothetical protein BTR25_03600 [Bacillus sp. MRMR6]
MESILFLIIVWVLSSIFGKAKGKGKPARTSIPKGFKDIQTLFEEQEERPPSPKTISTGQSAARNMNEDNFSPNVLQTNHAPARRIGRSEGRLNEEKRPLVKEGSIFQEKPDEKTIINGIIWSEILNEPRSKRPHFSKRGR